MKQVFGVSKSHNHRLNINRESIRNILKKIYLLNQRKTGKRVMPFKIKQSVLQWFKEMHNPTYKCKPLWDIKNLRRQTASGMEESNALLGLICVYLET